MSESWSSDSGPLRLRVTHGANGPSLAVDDLATGRRLLAASVSANAVELRVDPDDLGKVIGKQGRTARAIRTLLGTAGSKDNKRVLLEILE